MEFKYYLIISLYLPLAIYGCLNVAADYKLKKASSFVASVRLLFWIVVLVISILADRIVEFAIDNNYTQADFLTNYDVITMFIVLVLVSFCTKFYSEMKLIKRKFNLLHEQIAIDFATRTKEPKK